MFYYHDFSASTAATSRFFLKNVSIFLIFELIMIKKIIKLSKKNKICLNYPSQAIGKHFLPTFFKNGLSSCLSEIVAQSGSIPNRMIKRFLKLRGLINGLSNH